MSKVRCSRYYYNRLSPDAVDTFAVGVRDGVFGHPAVFTAPPFTLAAFQTHIDNYMNTRAAYKQGGKAQKGAYLAARAALLDALGKLADTVDMVANGHEETILIAGFVPTKARNSGVAVPAVPHITALKRGPTHELFAECAKVAGARYYGCILVQGQPLPALVSMNGLGQLVGVALQNESPANSFQPANGSIIAAIDLTQGRKKHFVGLQKGVDYYFYFYAGNASGVSALSAPECIMCG